jgi:hypothetical protein
MRMVLTAVPVTSTVLDSLGAPLWDAYPGSCS